jgi:hypothetical protein
MIYTNKEKTEKKYTVAQAESAALAIIKDRSNGKLTQVCTNATKDYRGGSDITVVKLNELSDQMVNDTFYYDGYKMNL